MSRFVMMLSALPNMVDAMNLFARVAANKAAQQAAAEAGPFSQRVVNGFTSAVAKSGAAKDAGIFLAREAAPGVGIRAAPKPATGFPVVPLTGERGLYSGLGHPNALRPNAFPVVPLTGERGLYSVLGHPNALRNILGPKPAALRLNDPVAKTAVPPSYTQLLSKGALLGAAGYGVYSGLSDSKEYIEKMELKAAWEDREDVKKWGVNVRLSGPEAHWRETHDDARLGDIHDFEDFLKKQLEELQQKNARFRR